MKSTDTIQHRWFEQVWNQGRVEVIDQLLGSDVIIHGLTDSAGNELRGSAAFKTFYQGFHAAFPDIHVVIEDTVSEGDKVLGVCRVTATHSGEGIGLKPTHKKVEFTGMCLVRVCDGKIVESWNSFDFLTLYQQIGLAQLTV